MRSLPIIAEGYTAIKSSELPFLLSGLIGRPANVHMARQVAQPSCRAVSRMPRHAAIVARLGTEKHRLAVPTRESEAFLSEIAESKGGNRQISAGAPLDSPKLAER